MSYDREVGSAVDDVKRLPQVSSATKYGTGPVTKVEFD